MFTRDLFSQKFADVKFRENENTWKWQNHSFTDVGKSRDFLHRRKTGKSYPIYKIYKFLYLANMFFNAVCEKKNSCENF